MAVMAYPSLAGRIPFRMIKKKCFVNSLPADGGPGAGARGAIRFLMIRSGSTEAVCFPGKVSGRREGKAGQGGGGRQNFRRPPPEGDQ